MEIMQCIDSIEQSFMDALGTEHFMYTRPYRATLEISGIRHESRIWVRITRTSLGVVCDISTIYFCNELRSRGLFTSIMNNLIKNKDIDEIRVSSVCTDEMHSACRKFKMNYLDSSMTYTLKTK